MLELSTLFYVKLVLALIVGFLVARRLKDVVLAFVFRFLPVGVRVSTNSFNMHTRLSTAIGFALLFGTAGLSLWGMNSLHNQFAPTKTRKVKPIHQSTGFSFQPSQPIVERKKETTPIEYEEPQEVPSTRVLQKPLSDYYYIQVSSFASLKNAKKCLRQWTGKITFDCWIAQSDQDNVPFKVLIGPFPSRDQAKSIRKRYNSIKGNVRKAENLEFLPQAQ